jgi:hypothetical protein
MAKNFKTGIIVTGDAKGAVSAVQATESQIKKLNSSAKKSSKSISGLGKSLAGMAASAVSVAGIKKSIDAYAKQEQAIFQLEARLKSTGHAANISSEELQSMASSLQKVTTFGDEAIIEMQGLLLTFTQIKGPIFKEAQQAILDVSTALGKDLKSSALQLGKALNDPVLGLSALAESGIQFSDQQKNMIKSLVDMGDVAGAQSIILKELNTQFGGSAEAAAKGTGIIKQLSNAWGDVSEQTGKSIMSNRMVKESLEGLLGAANAMAGNTSIEEWAQNTNVFLKGIAAVAKTVTTGIENLGLSIGALAAASGSIASGDFAGVGAIWDAYKEDLSANNDELSDFYTKLAGIETVAATSFDELAKSIGSASKETDSLSQSLSDITEKDKAWMEQKLKFMNGEEKKAREEQQKLYEKQRDNYRQLMAAMADERQQLLMTDKERFIHNQLLKLGTDAKKAEIEAARELAGALYDERIAMEESNLAVQETQKVYEESFSRINDAVNSTFRSMLDGGGNVFDKLASGAKSMVKDIVAELLTLAARPFVISLTAAGSGLLGLSSPASAADLASVAGQGGGFGLSNISNLFTGNSVGDSFAGVGNFIQSTFGDSFLAANPSYASATGQSALFSNAGSYSNLAYGGTALLASFLGDKLFGGAGGIGASIGSTLGLAVGGPLGAVLGGLGGGLIGGFFGDDKPDDIWFNTFNGEGANVNRGNLIDNEGIEKFLQRGGDKALASANGGLGKFSVSAWEDFQGDGIEEAQRIVEQVTALDAQVAAVLSPEAVTNAITALDGEAYHAKAWSEEDKNGATNAMQELIMHRYSTVLDSLSVDGLTDLFKTEATQDNILALAPGLAAIGGDFAGGKGLFGQIIEGAIFGGDIKGAYDSINSYAGTNETLVDTYARLTAEASIFSGALDFMGLSFVSGIDSLVGFADEMANAAGGVDALQGLWGSYFDNYYNDQERAQIALEQSVKSLNSFMSEAGLQGLGLTVDNFRERFESALVDGLGAAESVDWLSASKMMTEVNSLASNLVDVYQKSEIDFLSPYRSLAEGGDTQGVIDLANERTYDPFVEAIEAARSADEVAEENASFGAIAESNSILNSQTGILSNINSGVAGLPGALAAALDPSGTQAVFERLADRIVSAMNETNSAINDSVRAVQQAVNKIQSAR